MQSLFISEDAFSKYKNQIIGQIFSKWQLYFSIPSFLYLAIAFYNLTLHNYETLVFGNPPSEVGWANVYKILIGSWYFLFLGVIYFAGSSFNWAFLCIIVGLMRLKDAEGLKIQESIKTFKTLINIKQYDEEAVEKSLEGYYTYNRFVTDAGKITEFLLFFAVLIAIPGILISINWIVIGGGLKLVNWIDVRDNIALAIFLDIFAILIFISPLFSIHGALKDTKSKISNIINDVYEHNKIHAVVQSVSFSHVDEKLINNISSLKGIVDEVDSLKTWPVDLEAIVRLTATTIVPTVLLIVSKINELMGNPK